VAGTVVLTPLLADDGDPLQGAYNWALYQKAENAERVRVDTEAGDTVRFTVPPGR